MSKSIYEKSFEYRGSVCFVTQVGYTQKTVFKKRAKGKGPCHFEGEFSYDTKGNYKHNLYLYACLSLTDTMHLLDSYARNDMYQTLSRLAECFFLIFLLLFFFFFFW